MPYSRPSLTQLIARARDDFEARMPGVDSRLRRSVADALATIHAGAMSGLYGLVDWVWRQILPDTAEREQLDRWALIFGVTRKAVIPASGSVTLAGVSGSVVPAGSLLVRSDGTEYATTLVATLVLGAATVPVVATAGGEGGNAPVGQRLTFTAPIAGVNAVAIVAAGGLINGAGEEDDEAMRARLLTRIRQPPHGGNETDYVSWALEVAGVTRAWVAPNEQGPGTVVVRFVMDERIDIIPLIGDVSAVQDYIDALRPVTAALTVVAPIAAPLAMTIRAVPPTPEVQAAIVEELADLLRREAEPGGTILISRIREAISLAAGEIDHEVIAPIGNVFHSTGQIAVPGVITWV